MQDPFNNQNQDPNDPLANFPLPPNYAKIKDPKTGKVRVSKVGFSWTSFLFGPLPSIFRGDWYNFALIIVLQIAYTLLISMLGFENINSESLAANVSLLINLIPSIILGLCYNLIYFRHSFYIGYEPADDRSKELLVKARYWKD